MILFQKLFCTIATFSALSVSFVSDAQTWSNADQITHARFESSVVQYNDDIYVFNGFGAGIKIQPTVEKFDAGSRSWSVVSNTSAARGNAMTHNGVVRVGNEVWLIGGRVGSHPGRVTAQVWKYNLSTSNWSQGPSLPVAGAAGGAALVDNKIHWFGGLDTLARCDVSNHFVFDLGRPGAGWKNISGVAAMPSPRNHFGTVVHGGLIYAIGGQFTHGGCGSSGTPDTSLVHAFNPRTNQWTQKASLPLVQSHTEPSSFVHKGAIYVIGGATVGNKVFRYNPAADDWDIVMQLPQALLAPIARVVDNELVVSSGGAPNWTQPSEVTYTTEMAPLLLSAVANDRNDRSETEVTETPDTNNETTNIEITNSETTDTVAPVNVSGNTSHQTITLEAEHFVMNNASGTHQWVTTGLDGASDSLAMVTTPDNGTLRSGSVNSPSLGYFAYFDRAGTWYMWVRGWGDSNTAGLSDSVHAGLNGQIASTADKIDGFPSGWHWSSSTRDGVPASLNIPSVGVHKVDLWMREDGLVVDKILLTSDAAYVPVGSGPAHNDGTSPESNESTDVPVSDSEVLEFSGSCDYSQAHLAMGWGWDPVALQSCASVSVAVTRTCVDADGDGWGWNGVDSCRMDVLVESTPTDEGYQADTACIDTDGDGWGWDGKQSCIPD